MTYAWVFFVSAAAAIALTVRSRFEGNPQRQGTPMRATGPEPRQARCPNTPLHLALLLATSLGGCGTDSDAGPRLDTVVDSAGIRVISLAEPPQPAGEFTTHLLWKHGARPGDYPFQNVRSGTLLADGSAVVADGTADEVVRLRDGAAAEILMTRGQGPSEATGVVGVAGGGGDSVWVDDDGNSKLVLLDGEGTVTSTSVAGRYDLSIGLRLRGVDAHDDLWMSTSSFPRDPPDPAAPWRMGELVRLDPETLRADTVASYEHAPILPNPNDTYHPFLPYGTVTVAGGRWVTARADKTELVWLGEDGEVVQILRWSAPTRSPTTDDLEEYTAWSRNSFRRVNPGLSPGELRQGFARSMGRVVVDESIPIPHFRDIIGSRDGHVWIEDFEPGLLPASRFTVVSPEGEWLGRVVFPSPVVILDIRDSHVLAVVQDEYDVRRVAVICDFWTVEKWW